MSGVIDENGVQWEHCNCCGGWVKIQELWYTVPDEENKYGLDLCTVCKEVYQTNRDLFRHISNAVTEAWYRGKEAGKRAGANV